ncbi:hypothetical protein D3C71_1450950 [compost metagenome]
MQAGLELGVQDRIQAAGAQRFGQVGGDHRQQLVRGVEARAETRMVGLGHPWQRGQRGIAPAQLGRQRMGKADPEPAEALAARRVVGQQRAAQPGQAARFVDQLAPQLAAFPPALETSVVAEAQEDRQDQAKQGERGDRNPLDARRVPDLGQGGHGDGQQQDRQHLGGHRRNDGAAQDVQQLPAVGTRTNDHRKRKWRPSGRGPATGALRQPLIVRPCTPLPGRCDRWSQPGWRRAGRLRRCRRRCPAGRSRPPPRCRSAAARPRPGHACWHG